MVTPLVGAVTETVGGLVSISGVEIKTPAGSPHLWSVARFSIMSPAVAISAALSLAGIGLIGSQSGGVAPSPILIDEFAPGHIELFLIPPLSVLLAINTALEVPLPIVQPSQTT
jgi:hypothetical protein